MPRQKRSRSRAIDPMHTMYDRASNPIQALPHVGVFPRVNQRRLLEASLHDQQSNTNIDSDSTITDEHDCLFDAGNFYSDLGDPIFSCTHCGALFWKSESVGSTAKPMYNLCCKAGLVQIPKLKHPPPILDTLLSPDSGPPSIFFRKNIRMFNSMFAFTSFGANIETTTSNCNGPYVFKISGQIYHRIGSLLPQDNVKPKFAQLYIYDTENEISNRASLLSSDDNTIAVTMEITKQLTNMLNHHNRLVQLFRTARDKYQADGVTSLKLRLIGRRVTDGPEYELPSCRDIGGLIVGDIGENEDGRDIIIDSKTEGLKRISFLHPSYMALQYPLLFPYGEDGHVTDRRFSLTDGQRTPKRLKISMREFYCFQLHSRANQADTIFKSGRLFQQYIVDAYACVEEERLNYVRRNQKNLRSEIYQGIVDAVVRGDRDSSAIGKRVVLPSSHTGSPRYMIQNYQDAMAICRQYGNPDLFITFTCNPKWPEIQRALSKIPNQRAEDRPEIVCRIFKMKLDDMVTFMKTNSPFGRVRANLHVVEFQKRGLPHCHFLFWLDTIDKLSDKSKIDPLICAEIPDPNTNPLEYNIVAEFMVHGPCGLAKTSAPCMKNKSCSKRFPKPYCSETIIEENGYIQYRRRDNNFTIEKQGMKLDNRYIVPYNKELLLRYMAHINVEVCSQSMLIKYLFKYLTKGPDRIRAVLELNVIPENSVNENVQSVDEIKNFLNCRYLTPYEAMWRLYEYPIHHRLPAIQRLSVHLPSMQNVTYHSNQRPENILGLPGIRKTTLTEWMETNKVDDSARELKYIDFPKKYVWNARDKIWTPRTAGNTIGRTFFVHPSSGELYYLKLLLNHKKGATSYDDIRTINGLTYSTYQEACFALGVLGNDKEWEECITEAAIMSSSAQLRNLFVIILLFCNVNAPNLLFEHVWRLMVDDILHRSRNIFNNARFRIPDSDLKDYVLYELEHLLNGNSSSLQHFNLPSPSGTIVDTLNNRLLREELNQDIPHLQAEHASFVKKLNAQQTHIYNAIIEAFVLHHNKLFFVYGSGGTGKTFLWNAVITKIRSLGKIILAVASSGIASLLLPNGRTAHSRFKIPLSIDKFSTCHIKKKTQLSALIDQTHIILWDEAPMTNKYCFEALDKTLQDLKNCFDKPFGGMTIVLGGDFRQILPIIPTGSREHIIDSTINNSYLWPYFSIMKLTENMRLQRPDLTEQQRLEVNSFSDWILQIGDGVINGIPDKENEDATWIQIPSRFLISYTSDPIPAITNTIYSDLLTSSVDVNYFKERAIITPTNKTVHEINDYIISLLPGQFKTYFSYDTILSTSDSIDELNLLYPQEFLNTLNFSGLPSHELHLKIGTPIMLIRNLDQTNGLCNGTRLIITQLTDRLIEGRIINSNNFNDKVYIPRIEMSVHESKWPFTLKRRQFPIKICYAMTINKSQGQSLNKVGLYLDHDIFTHGQLYVALSRATSPDGLHVLIHKSIDTNNGYIKNIVYKEILHPLAEIESSDNANTDNANTDQGSYVQ